MFESRYIIAWFYSDEALKSGIAVSAFNFLLSPFIITITALMRRDMSFSILARCNLAGNFVTATASITLALFGYSFMAPILGLLAGNAAVLVLLITSRGELRIFLPSFRGYRNVIGFGAYSSSTIILNVFYNLAPQLILARVLGFDAVGLYSRAYTVTQMLDRSIIQVLNPVIMPAIVAHTRSGVELKRIFLDSIELLSAVVWPFLSFVALMAAPIVWIWFGPNWVEIVPLIRILCIASLSLFAACLTYPVLVAAGSVRDTLISSLISLPPSLLALFVASSFGLQAVAAITLLTLPFQSIVAFYFIRRHLVFSIADLIGSTLRSAAVTLSGIAAILLSMLIVESFWDDPILELALASAAGAAGWWLGLIMTNHPLMVQISFAAGRIPIIANNMPGFLLGGIGHRIRSEEKCVEGS